MDSRYELVDGAVFRRKVRAIILDEQGLFLLIQPQQYKDGFWTFVGGGVEAGESGTDAITREIHEEVGLSHFISVQKSQTRHIYKFDPAKKRKTGETSDGQIAEIFWVCVPTDSKIEMQAEEVKNYIWASLSDVREFVKVPAQLELFEKVILEFHTGLNKKIAR